MSFQAIKDQETAQRLLRNALTADRIPSGFFFWGPDGVGKKTFAYEVAKALNCERASGEACDDCISCQKTDRSSHPDVRLMEPHSRARMIRVEAIEEIVELSSYPPYQGKWRIVIINEAERMHVFAQNKLLKTLEEPPGRTLFILLSEFPRLVLPTIRSRCQMVRFRTLSTAVLKDILRDKRDIPPAEAEAIARLAQGQVNRALDLVDTEKRVRALGVTSMLAEGRDPVVVSDELIASIEALKKIYESEAKAQVSEARKEGLSSDELEEIEEAQEALAEMKIRQDVREMLYLLETWYRDQLVVSVADTSTGLFNADKAEDIRRSISGDPSVKIEAIETARMQLTANISRDRVFRNLLLALAA